jgi:hypothetical protein
MTKYLLAAVSAVALTGCTSLLQVLSPTGPTPGAGLCAIAREHCVKVSIQGGVVTVDQPTVQVMGRGRIHWIVWYLDTPGYQFVSQSGNRPIIFKTATNGQFDSDDSQRCYAFNNSQWLNDRVFVCIDANSQGGSFSYGIKVTGSPAVPTLDPIIVNN